MKNSSRSKNLLVTLLVIGGLNMAYGQESTAIKQESNVKEGGTNSSQDTEGIDTTAEELANVVVLGSRSLPRVSTSSPVPVDVIDMQKAVANMPQVNLNSMLNYTTPSFTSTTQTVADATDHIDPASLRGLGPDQTLVLLNGKRRHTTSLVNINGTVGRGSVGTDLNAIPSIALERLEVLRDGAAAQYGSDAIAGVINLGLRRNNKGTKVIVTYGANVTNFKSYTEATKGDFTKDINPVYHDNFAYDGQVTQVALNQGLALGKKGFVNLSAAFDYRGPTNRAGEGTGALTASSINSNATTLANDEAFLQKNNLIRNDIRNRVGQSELLGGQFFLNSEYTVHQPSKSAVYAFGGLSYRNGSSAANYRKPGNSNNMTSKYPVGFLPFINSNIWDGSFAIGIKGLLAKKWNYDFSGVGGVNYFGFSTDHSLNASSFSKNSYQAAANAGVSIDSNQANFDAGGFMFAQNTTNLDLSRLFPVLAGLNVAFGGEVRWEQFQQIAGEDASWADYSKRSKDNPLVLDLYGVVPTANLLPGNGKGAGAQGFAGISGDNALKEHRTSFATYVDLEQNFTKSFLINVAGRYEYYTDFGSNLSWKVASRLTIAKWLTLRASASTGFRAPSLHQRYTQKISTITTGGVASQSGTFRNDSKIATDLGIPSLKPEISLGVSAGFTVDIKKFKLTLDAYNIGIKDRIIYSGTFDKTTAVIASALIEANAEQASFFANALNTNTFGIDGVASYAFKISSTQDLKIDFSASYVKNTQVGDLQTSDQLRPQSHNYLNPGFQSFLFTAIPRFKSNFIINYDIKKWSFFVRESHAGQTEHVETAGVTKQGDNTKAPYFYKQIINGTFLTDISVSYNLTKNIKLTLGANNVFDAYTDLVNGASGKYYKLETDPSKADYNTLSSEGLSPKEMGIANNDALVGGASLGNQFNYSRRVSMIGLNGRFVFARVNITL